MRVLVVDDEVRLVSSLKVGLEAEGFAVDVAYDGTDGLWLAREHNYEAIVLDLMLPGIDGLEVCRRIQRERDVPVLMLTARDSEPDVLVGLGVGADDYMTKPFSMQELVARLHALLRRADRGTPAGDGPLRVGPLEIDHHERLVRQDGREVELTPLEFDLLHHLARRPGVVSSRDELLREVWGYADGTGPRTVDSHVRGLRRKLGRDTIRTARGAGYALRRPE